MEYTTKTRKEKFRKMSEARKNKVGFRFESDWSRKLEEFPGAIRRQG